MPVYATGIPLRGREQMDLSDHVRILNDKLGMLHRAIERRNFPIDLISEQTSHDACQAIEEAAEWVDALIAEWTEREFDGLTPTDQFKEYRMKTSEFV